MSATSQNAATAAPPPATAPEVRSLPLIATLAASGALCGLLIVVVYQLTLPAVERNRAARLDAAIHDVLHGIDHYQTLYLRNGALTPTLPAGVRTANVERVYEGFDASGARVGFAIPTSPAGFADTIELIVGFNPATRATSGLAILTSKETPGLGDKIESASFRDQFRRALTPLTGVKSGAGARPNDVDMITGATISSRAVINGINRAVDRWSPLLETYIEEVAR